MSAFRATSPAKPIGPRLPDSERWMSDPKFFRDLPSPPEGCMYARSRATGELHWINLATGQAAIPNPVRSSTPSTPPSRDGEGLRTSKGRASGGKKVTMGDDMPSPIGLGVPLTRSVAPFGWRFAQATLDDAIPEEGTPKPLVRHPKFAAPCARNARHQFFQLEKFWRDQVPDAANAMRRDFLVKDAHVPYALEGDDCGIIPMVHFGIDACVACRDVSRDSCAYQNPCDQNACADRCHGERPPTHFGPLALRDDDDAGGERGSFLYACPLAQEPAHSPEGEAPPVECEAEPLRSARSTSELVSKRQAYKASTDWRWV